MGTLSTRELEAEVMSELRGASAGEDRRWGELGLWGMIGEMYRGRNSWMAYYVSAWSLIVTVLLVWTGIRFFGASDAVSAIKWGVGFLMCGMFILLMKVWFWMQMDKNALRREIKRAELDLARQCSNR